MSVFVLRAYRDVVAYGEPSKVVVVADNEIAARRCADDYAGSDSPVRMAGNTALPTVWGNPSMSLCENIGSHNPSLSVPFIVAVES